MANLRELSGCELRLELAEAVAERPRTLKAIIFKRNRIAAVTAALVERGAF
jgi:hypothetical protein